MRVLVTGGTGAMGTHLCRQLAEAGNEVFVTTRRDIGNVGGIRFVRGDAKEASFLNRLLREGWDAVIDFMIWGSEEFPSRAETFLPNTGQYVFLSSYRVYAECPVITEESLRLLDVVKDPVYLGTDEYALRKARCEDVLRGSRKTNWTIVRPAITYDGLTGRLQLCTMESYEWLWRALNGVPIPLPEEMLGKQATMTYAADVARMICGLIGNEAAFGETYTTSSSDHITWAEVVRKYQSVLPFEITCCGLEEFIRVRGGGYQVLYDRMFDRVIDNTKALNATGLEQSDLTPMEEGLQRELEKYLAGEVHIDASIGANAFMDVLTGGVPSIRPLLKDSVRRAPASAAKYAIRRIQGNCRMRGGVGMSKH